MTRHEKIAAKVDDMIARDAPAGEFIAMAGDLNEDELDEAYKKLMRGIALKKIDERKEAMRANTKTLATFSKAGRHIDGIAHQGHHTVLFAGSGSYKTTFITALCMQALEENEALEVHYWGFDVNPPYVKAVDAIDHERFLLITNQTIDEMETFYHEYLHNELPLDNTIIVLDTYKFLSSDINNKNANKKAMHFIKDVCRRGAAWVSIHHSNKDGRRESGTAEIEQDCDALLRIDTVEDGNKAIANIKNGGRVRWGETNITIQTIISEEDKDHPELFWNKAIRNAEIIGNVNIERMKSLNEKAPQMEVIAKIILDYKTANNEGINQTELKKLIKENEFIELSDREIIPTLNAGSPRYWRCSMDKQNHNRKLYYPA